MRRLPEALRCKAQDNEILKERFSRTNEQGFELLVSEAERSLRLIKECRKAIKEGRISDAGFLLEEWLDTITASPKYDTASIWSVMDASMIDDAPPAADDPSLFLFKRM